MVLDSTLQITFTKQALVQFDVMSKKRHNHLKLLFQVFLPFLPQEKYFL